MRPYKPALETIAAGGFEQSFTSNVVHVNDTLVAFGEIVPDEALGLPHGTPVHSLLVHLSDEGPAALEFNDQENTVEADAVRRLYLQRDRVRFVFHRDAGPFAGRVSLSDAIELFEDLLPDEDADGPFADYERFDDVQLTSLSVRFDVDDARFAELRRKLANLPRG